MSLLTDQQVLAAAARSRLLSIVAGPGTGKTTVAAARFAVMRHAEDADHRAVLGVSFTRAASRELSDRVRSHWGSRSLTFPHLVTTLDDLHVRLLNHLLGLQLLTWPGGHTIIDACDSYAGQAGYRGLARGSWRRIAQIRAGGVVVSGSVKVEAWTHGFGQVKAHTTALESGRPSHEDVRSVLEGALKLPGVAAEISHWLGSRFRHIIVDEIYDTNTLDLRVVELAATNPRVGVTVVGDPFQAIYTWRGATPNMVPRLLTTQQFATVELTRSFRFSGTQMPELSRALRARKPVEIATIGPGEVDVVLAHQWSTLWDAGPAVLPVGFSNDTTGVDAALVLLLDLVTRRRFGRRAHGWAVAQTKLKFVGENADEKQVSTLSPVLEALVAGTDVNTCLKQLLTACKSVSGRRPHCGADAAKEAATRLRALRTRLTRSDLVMGLSVHQAKGGEWDRVGVAVTDTELRPLAVGLNPAREPDCVLYVACTRARVLCGLVLPTPQST